MSIRTLSFAVMGIVAILPGVASQAGAGGVPPGTLADCQTANPSGAPIVITLDSNFNIDLRNQIVNTAIISAFFHGVQVFGPYTLTDFHFAPAANQMDAACTIFGTPIAGSDGNSATSLGDEIVAAAGLRGTLKFTACSFLGGDSPDCTLRAPTGTINTPPGWLGGVFTGYAGH